MRCLCILREHSDTQPWQRMAARRILYTEQGRPRMSKTKMRCITCGKWFQSANAKEITCPECVQKARKDKLASKAAPQAAQKIPGQGATGSGNPVRPTA